MCKLVPIRVHMYVFHTAKGAKRAKAGTLPSRALRSSRLVLRLNAGGISSMLLRFQNTAFSYLVMVEQLCSAQKSLSHIILPFDRPLRTSEFLKGAAAAIRSSAGPKPPR